MKRAEPTGKTRSVLLVDDNKNGSAARKSVLMESGYAVETAASGHEALEEFQQQHFDLVVTDFRMPRMNGTELIAQLRAIRSTLPVIMLTGYVETGGLTEESTGANIVLPKGANEVQQLVRAVNRLLQHRSPRKPASSLTGARPTPKRRIN